MRIKESNMEHYRNEFLNILKDGKFPTTKNGKATSCGKTYCEECDFGGGKGDCYVKIMLWLMEDYKEKPTLTAREKHFVEMVEWGYIARDSDGELFMYKNKPEKEGCGWYDPYNQDSAFEISEHAFSFITDEESWSVEELRKLKVEND